MAKSDNACGDCGFLPSECCCPPVKACWPSRQEIMTAYTGKLDNWSNGQITGASITSGSTSVPIGTGSIYYPSFAPTPTVTQEWTLGCDEHRVDPETISFSDDEIHAKCVACQQKLVFPHIPGGLTFEKAGSIIGRAITVEEGDDLGQLLAELKILEDKIEKETARLRRASAMIEIARSTVAKRAAELTE